jgi:NADH-quinone oxidoreductase subunit G
MPKITVDGKCIECKDKRTILQACKDSGFVIPHYCYHPGLSIVASCRICLVEVEGAPRLMPACQTPIRDGMVVHTASSKATANQKAVMEFLLINHPLDCPVCDQAGECLLQDYSYQYGRSQSRFEEDKAKRPKKDVGEHIMLYSDRCIMCTRCVRFTREVSGTCELFVDGRGHREEIEIFPGKPVNNALAGNVVDLCPVGALLDKEFLFKQRVWFLRSAASISPVDAGGENIWIDYNPSENQVYRIKPRTNEQVNKWWISDATRYAWKLVDPAKRIRLSRRSQFGTQVETAAEKAVEQAGQDLRNLAAGAAGSLYGVLSPMMSCEEAWLLGSALREMDPQAVLVLGPAPVEGEDQVFAHYLTKKETFRIKAEKAPNAAGVRRVLAMLGGAQASWEELVKSETPALKKLKGGWIVGGYLRDWLPKEQPALFKKGYRVVQDLFENPLVAVADVVIPSLPWYEKSGTWENFAGVIQPFAQAVLPPEGCIGEGDVYLRLLGREVGLDAAAIRKEMGEPFAAIVPASQPEKMAEVEFVEL